jgi:hypothetical protein
VTPHYCGAGPPRNVEAWKRRHSLTGIASCRFRGLFPGVDWCNTLRRCADVLNIGKIACPSRRQLRGDQIVLRNKERRQAGRRINHAFNPSFPCGVKINAWKIGENIEAPWFAAKTKEAAAICEFFRANAFGRCAEPGKRCVGCGRLRGLLL